MSKDLYRHRPEFIAACAILLLVLIPSASATAATSVEPKEFGFSVAVARTESGFLVTGRTNLPPGTKMEVTFLGHGVVRTDQATVGPDSAFYAGEFLLGVGKYVPWPRGRYAIDIAAVSPARQVPELKYSFDYNGTGNFSAFKTAPTRLKIPRPNVVWAKKGIENRMWARIAAGVQQMIASQPEAATAAKPTDTDQSARPNARIISRVSFGCIDREYIDRLARYRADNDKDAWMSALQAGTNSGECVQFTPGESVYIDDTALFSGLIKVRRPGQTKGYWTNTEATN